MSNHPQPRGHRPMRSPFDAIRREEELPDGEVIEFWSAREAMAHLGYASWESMTAVVERAKSACRNTGNPIEENFRDTTKVSGQRGPRQGDTQLSRFAMYLVAMNGDPNKPEVAAAQRYFAIQTRRAEIEIPPLPPVIPVAPSSTLPQPRPWASRFRETFGDHYRHVHLNHPAGSFSVVTGALMQMMMLEDQLIRHMMEVQSGDRPCISIGKTWANYRKDAGKREAIGESPLYLPDQGFDAPVFVYGSEERVEFDVWLHNTYLPTKLVAYLGRKKEFEDMPQLPKDSVANNTCMELTGRPAVIPAARMMALTDAGGFVPALPPGQQPQLPPTT